MKNDTSMIPLTLRSISQTETANLKKKTRFLLKLTFWDNHLQHDKYQLLKNRI